MNPSLAPSAARLLIVDGHAYAYRAFYAIRALNGPDGLGTNAIYGFIKMLQKMQARVNPSHAAVIWDGGLAAERMTLHPDYKANRPSSPPDLDRQIDEVQEYLRASGVATCQQEGVEADDLICQLCHGAVKDGFEVVIASADKDFMPLVSERVGILNPNDKTETIWGAEQVRAKTGVEPKQVLDWLCLLGDAVDNIPGVPGVGPKTAADLLKQFGSIDGIYGALGAVKSERLRMALAESEGLVRKNLELIRLKNCAGSDVTLEMCEPARRDEGRLMELFQRWGFKGMIKELEERQEEQGCFL